MLELQLSLVSQGYDRELQLCCTFPSLPTLGNLGCGWLLVVEVTQNRCQVVGWQEMGGTAWIPVCDHFRDSDRSWNMALLVLKARNIEVLNNFELF